MQSKLFTSYVFGSVNKLLEVAGFLCGCDTAQCWHVLRNIGSVGRECFV